MAPLSRFAGRVGSATASIATMAEGVGPLEPSEVTLASASRGRGPEAIARPAHEMNDGTWQVDGLLMPLAGKWSARRDPGRRLRMIRLEGPVEIAP